MRRMGTIVREDTESAYLYSASSKSDNKLNKNLALGCYLCLFHVSDNMIT